MATAPRSIVQLQSKSADGHMAMPHMRVPTFYTFDQMRRAVLSEGKEVIIRSEHPSEQEGVSGVNLSLRMTLDDVPGNHINNGLFRDLVELGPNLFLDRYRILHRDHFKLPKYYCQKNALDLQTYVDELLCSFWEYIPGINLFVTQSARENEFHIFTETPNSCLEYKDELAYPSGVVDTGGDVLYGHIPPEVQDSLADVFALYRDVQNLFGKKSWMVEMQLTEDGLLYFLQRSNGRDDVSPDWTLGAPAADTDFVVGISAGSGMVCGSTPEEGIEVTLMAHPAYYVNQLETLPSALAFNHLSHPAVEQSIVRQIPVYLHNGSHRRGSDISDPHSNIIPFVMSEIYLHIRGFFSKLPDETQRDIKKLREEKEATLTSKYSFLRNLEETVQIRLHIVSDGCQAHVRILDVF